MFDPNWSLDCCFVVFSILSGNRLLRQNREYFFEPFLIFPIFDSILNATDVDHASSWNGICILIVLFHNHLDFQTRFLFLWRWSKTIFWKSKIEDHFLCLSACNKSCLYYVWKKGLIVVVLLRYQYLNIKLVSIFNVLHWFFNLLIILA